MEAPTDGAKQSVSFRDSASVPLLCKGTLRLSLHRVRPLVIQGQSRFNNKKNKRKARGQGRSEGHGHLGAREVWWACGFAPSASDSRPPRPPCRPAPRCTGGRRRPCRAAREEGGGLRRAAREEGGICAASRQRRAAGCEASIRRY